MHWVIPVCKYICFVSFTTPKVLKKAEFANSIDPDEAAHNEPPHLDLHCSQIHFFLFFLGL